MFNRHVVIAEISVKRNATETDGIFHENLMSWQLIGHNNDPLIKCAILLLQLELVDVSTINRVKLYSGQGWASVTKVTTRKTSVTR